MKTTHLPCTRGLDIGLGLTKFTKNNLEADGRYSVGVFPSLATSDEELNSSGYPSLTPVLVGSERFLVGESVRQTTNSYSVQFQEYSLLRSNQFKALARGALAMMDVPGRDIVDILVIGLPINLMGDQSLRQYMIDFMQTTHLHLPRLPSGKADRSITVDKVELIPQPAGSLLAWSADKGASRAFADQINLTIDVGFGSLQWLVTKGYSPLHEFCGCNIGGMSSLIHRMLQAIDREAATNINIVERLNIALLKGIATIKISGRDVDLSRYRQNLETAQQDFLSEFRSCINQIKNIDNIILTGGGASVYADHIRAVFPGREILMFDKDSHFANVRGFQNYVDMMGRDTGWD